MRTPEAVRQLRADVATFRDPDQRASSSCRAAHCRFEEGQPSCEFCRLSPASQASPHGPLLGISLARRAYAGTYYARFHHTIDQHPHVNHCWPPIPHRCFTTPIFRTSPRLEPTQAFCICGDGLSILSSTNMRSDVHPPTWRYRESLEVLPHSLPTRLSRAFASRLCGFTARGPARKHLVRCEGVPLHPRHSDRLL